VCLRGESLTHHTNQMKLLNAIVSTVVIGSAVPFISSAPAVAGCYPSVASSDYRDMLKAGTSPGKAMGVVMRDNNYDGSEDCRIKWNMEFWQDHKIKPFDNVRRTPLNKPTIVAVKRTSDKMPCWNRLIAHKPTGVEKVCLD